MDASIWTTFSTPFTGIPFIRSDRCFWINVYSNDNERIDTIKRSNPEGVDLCITDGDDKLESLALPSLRTGGHLLWFAVSPFDISSLKKYVSMFDQLHLYLPKWTMSLSSPIFVIGMLGYKGKQPMAKRMPSHLKTEMVNVEKQLLQFQKDIAKVSSKDIKQPSKGLREFVMDDFNL